MPTKKTAGYSGTPLSKKLGIKNAHVVVISQGPSNIEELLAPLPDAVTLRTTLRGRADVVLFFTKDRKRFQKHIEALGKMIFPAASVWICWPKKASKVPTDMTEDVIREVCLPLGLVDVKVCAVDATWSGLKLMWRKELRK